MSAIANLLRGLGSRVVNGIWRLGFVFRFLAMLLVHQASRFAAST